MRLILNFNLKTNRIPCDYRPFCMSIFKGALAKEYPEVFNDFYDKNKGKFKAFSFSVYFKNPKREGDFLVLQERKFKLIISCAEYAVMNYFYNALQKHKNKPVNIAGGNACFLKTCILTFCEELKGESANVKFLSPFLVRLHNKETNKDKYLQISDSEFFSTLIENIKSICKNFNISFLKFSIAPLKATAHPTYCQKRTMLANYGEYKIEANNEVLNFLYKAGLGSRRSEGFGLFEVQK